MHARRLSSSLAFVALVVAFNAVAEGEAASAEAAAEQTDQLVLPAGKLAVQAFLEANLSKDAAFKPVSLSPDVWYGATDLVTVGLVHSGVGSTGFLGTVGHSLCLSGQSDGCAHFYSNLGIDARIRLKTPLAVDAGLFVLDISDPFMFAAKVGLDGRWRFDRITVEALPSLFIGMTNRAAGNKDVLSLPVLASYQLNDRVELAVQSGVQLRLEQAGDNYRVPLSLAARYQVNVNLGLGLAFTLPALLGPSALPHGFDARTLMLGGSYAF